MSIRFNADEVLSIAEQIELNGVKFYESAARIVSDPQVSERLQKLSAWEATHAQTFTAMRNELSAKETELISLDPDNELALYLKAVADGKVFDTSKPPSDEVITSADAKQIFNIALIKEYESIAFYTAIKELIPQSLGSDKVDNIIKEEMGHVAQISIELSKL